MSFSLRFEKRFQKAPSYQFSRRISEDGKPNRRNKDEFSNFSDVVLTGPELLESRQLSALFEKPNNVTVNKIIIFKIIKCFAFQSFKALL